MKFTTLLLALFLAFSAFAQDKELEQESKIDAVTVFFQKAEVLRTAKVNLPAGRSTIRFTGISQYLEPSSLQVSGKGRFTILSVKHELNFLNEEKNNEEIAKLQEKIKELQEKMENLNADYTVFANEEALLNENRRIGGSQTGVDVAGLKELASYYRNRMLEIKDKQLEIKRAKDKIQKELSRYQKQLSTLVNTEHEPTSEVLVYVDAKSPVSSADFEIKYMTGHAGWYPSYDIRGEGLDQPLQIEWKAHVSQQSGEDWTNVKLKFSTGNPALGSVKPELDIWYIDWRNGYPYAYHSGGTQQNIREVEGYVIDANTMKILPYTRVQVVGSPVATFSDSRGHFSMVLPKNAQYLEFFHVGYQKARYPVQQGTMMIYLRKEVDQLQNVVYEEIIMDEEMMMDDVDMEMAPPSAPQLTGVSSGRRLLQKREAAAPPQVIQETETISRTFEIKERYTVKSEGSPVTAVIARSTVPAHFRYYAAPKLDPDAFLVAEITAWDTLNLLAGEANLYFEGTFVGKSIIDPSTTGDTLSLSLGRDPSVVISRKKVSDYTRKRFLANKKVLSIGWEISVRNKKDKAITIILQDQVPVSRNSEIEVTVDRLDGARYDKENGHLEWTLEVPPSGSKVVRFGYTVKYPGKGEIRLE